MIVGPVNNSARGDQVLVKRGPDYFVVSSVHAPFTGFETLVFPANGKGEVTDWGEVAGGRGMTREQAIQQLEDGTDYSRDWDDDEDDDQ